MEEYLECSGLSDVRHTGHVPFHPAGIGADNGLLAVAAVGGGQAREGNW